MDRIEKQEILHVGEMLDERFGERQFSATQSGENRGVST
jgi:hypothetical protein